MSSQMLHELIQQVNSLTVDEQLRLAAYLVQRARESYPLRRKWREIRGAARPSLLGEDAQAWVSRTRLEAMEHREHPRRTES